MAVVAGRDEQAGHHGSQAGDRKDEPELAGRSPQHVADVDDQDRFDAGEPQAKSGVQQSVGSNGAGAPYRP